jgi:uroporphyrin-3 C-methyltransferase
MTAHNTQQPNREPEPDADQAQKPAAAGMFARISLTQLTLSVLVLIFLWQWLDAHREISAMQQQLAAKFAEMDGNGKARQIMLEQDQEQVRELFAKVTTLETNYAEAQNQQASLKALYNDLSANRDKTVLAEIEQLLLIAEQQLQLSGNVKAALIAMQSADDRLKRLNRATLNGLRNTLGEDMDKLRALPNVDITGINGQLNNLIGAVDQLQLVYQQHVANEDEARAAPPKDETSWQKLLREIWQEMKQLVRIENTGKAEIPLLPPDQEFYLRENLKLHLLAARFDLLSRDENGFRQELKTAQTWTERYFDGKTNRSARMLDELKKLAASKINVELPDISSSLQMVRNYRLSRENEPKARFEERPGEPKAQR